MWATIAFLIGVAFVGIMLAVFRAREMGSTGSSGKPTALGWLTLAIGVVAAISFAVGVFGNTGIGGNLASIACASTAVIIGIGAALRYDRSWPTWAGLVAGAIPGAFWITFADGGSTDSEDSG